MHPASARFVVALLVVTATPSVAQTTEPLAYPEGYRSWVHVKSSLIGPTHPRYETTGGFQHIYANPPAMVGYRTRTFPDGSIIVFDWLELRDQPGAFQEGRRRQIDVMVKDSLRFAATGGWGFQRFVKDSRVDLAPTPTPAQCLACHRNLGKDGLVLSSYHD